MKVTNLTILFILTSTLISFQSSSADFNRRMIKESISELKDFEKVSDLTPGSLIGARRGEYTSTLFGIEEILANVADTCFILPRLTSTSKKKIIDLSTGIVAALESESGFSGLESSVRAELQSLDSLYLQCKSTETYTYNQNSNSPIRVLKLLTLRQLRNLKDNIEGYRGRPYVVTKVTYGRDVNINSSSYRNLSAQAKAFLKEAFTKISGKVDITKQLSTEIAGIDNLIIYYEAEPLPRRFLERIEEEIEERKEFNVDENIKLQIGGSWVSPDGKLRLSVVGIHKTRDDAEISINNSYNKEVRGVNNSCPREVFAVNIPEYQLRISSITHFDAGSGPEINFNIRPTKDYENVFMSGGRKRIEVTEGDKVRISDVDISVNKITPTASKVEELKNEGPSYTWPTTNATITIDGTSYDNVAVGFEYDSFADGSILMIRGFDLKNRKVQFSLFKPVD